VGLPFPRGTRPLFVPEKGIVCGGKESTLPWGKEKEGGGFLPRKVLKGKKKKDRSIVHIMGGVEGVMRREKMEALCAGLWRGGCHSFWQPVVKGGDGLLLIRQGGEKICTGGEELPPENREEEEETSFS